VPLRSFTAPDGVVWRVWQVTPSAGEVGYAERRVRDRRSPDPVLLFKGDERRQEERRKGAPRRSLLGAELERGWLTFESASGKKRLVPPPEGWAELAEPGLLELWRRAANVARSRPAPEPREVE
jgi:hypothetical protein